MFFLHQEKDLIINNKVQALYFYSSWMPFNKKMLNMLSKCEIKYPNIDFFAIDVDFFKNICYRFNIETIPTIVILNNGNLLKKINGIVMTSALKSAFSDIYKLNPNDMELL